MQLDSEFQIRIQMVLLGFGGAPSRTAEGKRKGWAYLEDALVAGKGLGEDVTNGAAARPVVAAREGRDEERVREKGKEMNPEP